MAAFEAKRNPAPSGILVIIGGKEDKVETVDKAVSNTSEDNMEILKTFASFLKSKNAVVEVITSASASGDELFADYKKAFNQSGIKKVGHIHHITRNEVLEDDVSERINEADAIFFSGGDQLLLTSLYGGTPFLRQLKTRYRTSRIVIGGTSAGAMAMSTTMIYAGNKEVQQISGEIKIATGLQFMNDVCIDTHFVDRGRFVRLAQVIATNPNILGIGIEENTAIVVRNGWDGEIIGSGTVITVDGSEIESSNITAYGEGEAISIRNLRVNILSNGEKFNFKEYNHTQS